MIISCGEALVDLVPEPVPGGGPMNAAIAARRLGAPTAFVGRISNDRHWQEIWRFLTENDVDTRACERGDEQTARAIVEHVPLRGRSFSRHDAGGSRDRPSRTRPSHHPRCT